MSNNFADGQIDEEIIIVVAFGCLLLCQYL